MKKVSIPISNPLLELNGEGFTILLKLCEKYRAFYMETLCILAKNCLNCHNTLEEFLDSVPSECVSDYCWDNLPSWRTILEKWEFGDAASFIHRHFREED